MRFPLLLLFILVCALVSAQNMAPEVRQFVQFDDPVIALLHARVVDGTGNPAKTDQTLILRGGKVESVGDAGTIRPPGSAKILDLNGRTIIPGLVGMHDHLFYRAPLYRDGDGHVPAPGLLAVELAFTAPRLYLAAGVTTMRTTGSVEPYADLNFRNLIDTGKLVGPTVELTAPYLDGLTQTYVEMHLLTGPDDARRHVAYWADEGFTSFKAYVNITRAELAASIEEAHKRGFKLTGHLCSVGWREAIARH